VDFVTLWAGVWVWVRDTVGDNDDNQLSAGSLLVFDLLLKRGPTLGQVATLVPGGELAELSAEGLVAQVVIELDVVLWGSGGVSDNTESGLGVVAVALRHLSAVVLDSLSQVSNSVEHFSPGVSHARGGVQEHQVVNVASVDNGLGAIAVAVAVVGVWSAGGPVSLFMRTNLVVRIGASRK